MEVSAHLAEAIETRRTELGLSPTAFAEATGLSLQALRNLRRGEVRRYQDRLTMPVTRVLGWTPDSIDRLLRGEPPQLRTDGKTMIDLFAERRPGHELTHRIAVALRDAQPTTLDEVEEIWDANSTLQAVARQIRFQADRDREEIRMLRDRVGELGQMVRLLLDEARGRLGAESDFAARLAALEAARDQRPSL